MDNNIGVLIVILAIAAYFLPTIAAVCRRHKNVDPIFAVNLFLGWTFLGWVLSFAWSLSCNTKERKVKGHLTDSERRARMEELEKLVELLKTS